MFGIGFPELILIMALALIVVGPDKLPELARSLAKMVVDLKKTAEGLKESIDIEDNPLSEIKPRLEDAAKNFKETILDAETQTTKSLPEAKNSVDKNIHDIYSDYKDVIKDGEEHATSAEQKAPSIAPSPPSDAPPDNSQKKAD